MDHYKTLGIDRNATKQDIKDAFRRSALQFHPDRHSQSSKEVRDGASLKFKQVSEAYEVLVDDRKRADYDLRSRSSFDRWGSANRASSSSYSYSYSSYQNGYGYGGGGGYRRPPTRGAAVGLDWEFWFRLVTTKGFLVNMAFASALLGGAYFVEKSLGTIWEVNNSGKSFEDAMDVIEKVKAQKKN